MVQKVKQKRKLGDKLEDNLSRFIGKIQSCNGGTNRCSSFRRVSRLIFSEEGRFYKRSNNGGCDRDNGHSFSCCIHRFCTWMVVGGLNAS